MNKSKYFIYIIAINNLFAAGGGGSWINDWLMPNTGLTLWTIATFLFLLFVLRWKAWGPLMDALDARAKQIEESLSKAEKVTADAEVQAEKNEQILQDARNEAQEIISKAREAGDKLKQKLESDGKNQYDSMLNKAKNQIESEKQKALNEIKDTVVDVALKASEKVIKRNLNADDNKKMIEETVDKFKHAN
ncbi:MAG: ATP synthase F0 subunit B [Candidatus Marinimicrobia bacterium]|nr:ATP synthase F0 subunit B [Candidatus Neomarinimicrobiota bacterium]|tara:strand:- start:83 stop:655 length:573 start_codon:yes stop_codon:yes gene_type:complete